MGLIVYGAAVSPFVRKVRVVLAEKGLEYKHEQVNPFQPPPEFLEISPLRRIPVLRDTDRPEPNTLPDSSIICDYLEHKFPKPALYPSDAFDRGCALWFEEYADSLVAQTVGRELFFERIIKKLIGQGPEDPKIITTTLKEKLPPIFDYLEKSVGSGHFLVANMFSIADISVATMLVNFDHCGERVDAARWPNLARYVGEIHARPSFKACIDEERPLVQRMRAA